MTGPDVPILAIPMRIDAITLEHPRKVPAIAPRFDRLPFFDGHRDVNSGVPYLGDAVTPRPFQDLSVELGAGVHLHWAIPAALRQAVHGDHGTTFPAVPDRWLVRRLDAGAYVGAWVVESDYLAPPSGRSTPGGLPYPVPAPSGQPFRYLGRRLDYAAWSPYSQTAESQSAEYQSAEYQSAEYLGRLSAVGYGDPAFAAYYPSCHSVFGFHDDSEPTPGPATYYTVCGWYSNPELDFVQEQRSLLAADLRRPPTTAELVTEFADRLKLAVPLDSLGRFPQRTVLYGEVTVPAAADDGVPESFPAIMIAPSAPEAMSAVLAHPVAAGSALDAALVEEQLDLIQLGSALDQQHVDIGFAFDEAAHQASFRPVSDGSIWRILPRPATAGTPADATTRPATDPPQPAALQLDDLNRLQSQRNDLAHRMDSLRAQLFADWQKFMIGRYSADPDDADALDPDRTMSLLENGDLAEFTDVQATLRRLDARIRTGVSQLEKSLLAAGLMVKQAVGPRYWQPAEPFVLLTGEGAQETSRLRRPGRDGPLASWTIQLPDDASPVDMANLAAEFIVGQAGPGWTPFLLEWEAEFFAMPTGGDVEQLPPDHLFDNYDFTDRDVDLHRKDGREAIRLADVYSGRSLLTGGAGRHVSESIDAYLWQRLAQASYWGAAQPPEQERTTRLDDDAAAIAAWIDTHTTAEDPLRTAFAARQQLAELPVLGQALSGFTAAMLMQRNGYQLPVDDPIGFFEYREITDRVRRAVGHRAHYTTAPLARFHPLRAGDLSLLRLRLVDTFGRSVAYERDDSPAPVASSRLLPPASGRTAHVHLPPRLVQPARLDFRWLSAAHADLEVSDHPATSPICGWFSANRLDGTLMVFDDDGIAAGSILTGPDLLDPQTARWLAAPGGTGVAHPSELANPYLAAAVDRLRRLGPEQLAVVVRALDATLDLIEPDDGPDHADLALLTGRPFALVRARLEVQLKGRAALNQSWPALEAAMRGPRVGPQHDGGIGRLRIPVRLGEFRQLDDGMLGYWVDAPGGMTPEPDRLRLAQIDVDEGGGVDGHHDLGLTLTVDDAPLELSLLMDPRATVHVSCGLLPAKTLTIPADHHRDAMDRLELNLLSAPVLSPQNQLAVTLPDRPGAAWSWVERRGATWTTVDGADLATSLPPVATGRYRLREGWLRLRPAGEGS